jgi:20S proteasome alpha/beta subunit
MTLIVAVKSEDAVIIAADSQISYDHSSKRMDIDKIEQVKFKNFPALVALSGNVANAHRFIDILRRTAAQSEPASADETGIVVQTAMRHEQKWSCLKS